MRKKILNLIVVVVLILVIVKLVSAEKTKAAGQNVFGVCVSQVPQAWGQFKGGSQQTGLAFEDTNGTLRFITNFPCNSATPAVALEIRRTPGK
jgi:hypothetical protein